MSRLDYPGFVESLDGPSPPPGIDLALRALWFDAAGRPESAIRAARAGSGHGCLRVRGYLARKAGDVHEARRCYYYAGVNEWRGSHDSEWTDIAQALLVEGPVADAY